MALVAGTFAYASVHRFEPHLRSSPVAAVAKLTITGAWYIVLGGIAGIVVAAALHAEKEEAEAMP